MKKRIFIVIIIFILIICTTIVEAREEVPNSDGQLYTELNWDNYKNQPASYWIDLYNRIHEQPVVYMSDYELFLLGYVHHEEINEIIYAAYNDTASCINFDVTYNEISNGIAYDDITIEVQNRNVDLLGDTTGKTNEQIFEEKTPYEWAMILTGIQQKAVDIHTGDTYNSFTESELKIMKMMEALQANGYDFPELTTEQKEAIKDYGLGIWSGNNFSFDTYAPVIADNVETSQEIQNPQVNREVNTHTLGEIFSDANGFIEKGNSKEENLSQESLQKLSDTIYNIVFTVGVILTFIIGGILGIKFIISGVEGKAEIKAMLLPYVIGCVILFGSFTIWKVVLTITSETTKSSTVYEEKPSGGSTTHQSSSGATHGGSSGKF